MIKIKKLSFKGVGRFVELQEISFENLSNLVQIDGKNKNTGGSSGSGKSTVFNALDFLFGLNSTPNSMLQSRLTDETIFVKGEFDLDGQELVISRGKKLSISIDGEVTTGSSKITEEKLDQILSIPRDLFRPMLHKKQREPGFFLSFTPAETNSFLTDCLGLGNFKNNIAILDGRITDLSKMISSLVSNLDSASAGLKASQYAILALGPAPTKDVDQNAILELKSKMDRATEELSAVLSSQQLEEVNFVDLHSPKLGGTVYDLSYIDKYEKEIWAVQSKRQDLTLKEKDKEAELKGKHFALSEKVRLGKTAKEEATKAVGEILKIRSNICPRCEQSWVNDAAKEDENKTLEKINDLKNHILGGEHASVHMEVIEEQLKYLMSTFEDRTPEIMGLKEKEDKLRSLYAEEKAKNVAHDNEQRIKNSSQQETFNLKHRELRKKHEIESTQIRGQVDICRRSFEAAAMKLRNYEDVRKRYEGSLDTMKEQEKLYAQKVVHMDQSLVDIQRQMGIAEELKRAIKSYLSCSFDEALEVISENATKMIQNIPNMATATIQLEGTKETKEGKVKEEVNSVIHMDGEENIPIKTLSGGERAAVDIAIDIAVLGLIEDRTNKGIDVFILDEPFTGLDGTNIEMVLEVLKNANMHKKLIVVDHNPVVKEQISDRITIIRDGLTSTVTQN